MTDTNIQLQTQPLSDKKGPRKITSTSSQLIYVQKKTIYYPTIIINEQISERIDLPYW